MHRIPVAAISTAILFWSSGQSLHARAALPERAESVSTTTSGRVNGFVRDAAGLAVAEASVLAIGPSVVAARSDLRGRFSMALPPGDYILRATRAGYVSTYREPVRVQNSMALERVITLIRQGEATMAENAADSHAHTDLAWRLRHLPRSVLRDAAALPEGSEGQAGTFPGQPAGSVWGRAMDSSMRLASRFADTNFSGQLNFVTTASATPGAFASSALPRSVAYVVVGAPIAGVGDWRIRGAIGSGTQSSWNVLGEFEGHRSEAHALRFGLSYSARGPREPGLGEYARSTLEARSVTGVFARDVWRPMSDLEVDYAVRADRYDFLSDPYLLSASGGMRARVLPQTFVAVRAGRSMHAPGAEEFLPPPAAGPWLPPERTFSALVSREGLRAETVRHVEIGLAQEFGPKGGARSIHVRGFGEKTADQIATLFSAALPESGGHYRVARAGSVSVSGWAAGVSGQWFGALTGTVEYSRLGANWTGLGRTRGLRRTAPSVVRDSFEWLDDVTATLDARMNRDRTRVSVVYRTNSAFSQPGGPLPAFGGRFDVQLHQALPYRPLPDSQLELMFAMRTLFRDPQAGSSRYDELLTVSPPLRLIGGIQVRF
jgi:hypothetical protein